MMPVFITGLNKSVFLGRDPVLEPPTPAEPLIGVCIFTVLRTAKGSREVRLTFGANLSDPVEYRLKLPIIDVPRAACGMLSPLETVFPATWA